MRELSGMSEAVRNVAMARYRMIQPYLEQKRSLAMVADDARRLRSNRSKMGKSVSEAWAGSSCAEVKRRPRRAKGSVTEDQGRD
jgi:hypothetical protein